MDEYVINIHLLFFNKCFIMVRVKVDLEPTLRTPSAR